VAARKPRSYRSALRQEQAAETRLRLLHTTGELLERGGADVLTLPQVAAAAGVSAPTVYRHFPTVADLLAAFLDWIRPQIGMTADRLLGRPAEEAVRLPAENFPLFEAHGALLRALIDSPAFNRVRLPSIENRAGRGAAVFRGAAPGWRAPDLAAAVGVLYVLGTPQTWRWLRDTWGLDPEDAQRAALWGMQALARALGEGPSALPRRSRPHKRPAEKTTAAKTAAATAQDKAKA
jgi:AcrR family transcriptional regulator